MGLYANKMPENRRDGANRGQGMSAGHADTARRSMSLLNNPAVRAYAVQAVVLIVLLWAGYEVVKNTLANLDKLNKNFGFDFFIQTAGFDILQSLIGYSSSSNYGRALMVGLLNTLMVAVIGVFFATILGFTAGIMRLSRNWLVAKVATIYVETVRNIPLLLQMFIWYGLVLKPLPDPRNAISIFDSIFLTQKGIFIPAPIFGQGAWIAAVFLAAAIAAAVAIRIWAKRRQEATGQQFPHLLTGIALVVLAPIAGLAIAGWPLTWDMPVLGTGFIKNFSGGLPFYPEFVAMVLALSIYTGAFIAEIVRAGILAVSHGQTEAAHALGLRHGPTLRLVIIPQALRVIIPPLASQYLNLTKNSSLATAIGYPDLVHIGGVVNNQSGRILEVVLIWMVIYLTLSLLTSGVMNWYNARKKLVER